MYLNFFKESNEGELIGYPVILFRVLVDVESDKFDILGETLIKLISEYKTYDKTFLMDKLGIPSGYGCLVDGELSEIIGNRVFDEKFKIRNLRKKEQKVIYMIYDKVNGQMLKQIIFEKNFESAVDRRNLNILNKVDETITFKIKDKDKYSREAAQVLLEFNSNSEEINEEDFALIPENINFYFNEILNLDSPTEVQLLIKVYQNDELQLQFRNPFLNVDSVYFKETIESRLEKQAIINSLNNIFMEEFGENLAISEQKKEYKKIGISDEDEINKEFIEIQKGLEILKSGLLDTQENQIIISMNKLWMNVFDLCCDTFYKSSMDISEDFLGNWVIENEIVEIWGAELANMLLKIKFSCKKGNSLKKHIQIKSLLSYYLILTVADKINFCSRAQEFIRLIGEDKDTLMCIENVRRFRNNTLHNNNEYNHYYDKNYDLSKMTIDRKIEIIEQLIEDTEESVKKFNKILLRSKANG